MALSAGNIIDVQTGGADTNAGFFDPTNANFATDLTTDANTANTASPIVSSASYNFQSPRDDNHWLFIKSGTNSIPCFARIVSCSGNKATIDASVGAIQLHSSGIPTGVNTSVGIATVGTPTNLTWGIDYSRSTAAIAFTDLVIDGTTNTDFTSAAKPGGKNFVGNGFNITSGTGFTVQRVQIISNPSGVIHATSRVPSARAPADTTIVRLPQRSLTTSPGSYASLINVSGASGAAPAGAGGSSGRCRSSRGTRAP